MTTFDECCIHYDLDADDPDALLQYQQYKEARELMLSIVGRERHQKQQAESELKA